jgi:hypothetical protein
MNRKTNLQLNLNKLFSGLSHDGPNTPIDQTVSTPMDPPNQDVPGANFYFHPPVPAGGSNMYSHPQYNESDDVLVGIDELKSAKTYSVNFTPAFDQLVLQVYQNLLSLPTTTPFSGPIPPSGLVSKVANETMQNLLTTMHLNNPPVYDLNGVITSECLKNPNLQPVFLQLIRRRLHDLCNGNSSGTKLPDATTVSISANGTIISNPLRQLSILNLLLNELNISNYNDNNINRSRSSSVNLRKHSLTRNNSYSNNNWLHVGNISQIKPSMTNHLNGSTESLQSMPDFVAQAYINRSANTSLNSNTNMSTSYNSMMMDYQTPPASQKLSIHTPPNNLSLLQSNSNEYDDFHFFTQNPPPAFKARPENLSQILTINTDQANIEALNALNGNLVGGNPQLNTLDSPFMLATSDESYFSNGFPTLSTGSSPSKDETLVDKLSGTAYTLNDKKRDSLKMKRGIH